MTDEQKPELEPLIDGWSLRADGEFFLNYSDEASVRRALATMARACGWPIVREEVVIPGWGRVDLLLQMDAKAPPHLIEIKLDLSRPAVIRRAFQQADGYGRWWQATHDQEPYVYLVPCKGDPSAINAVWKAYQLLECEWLHDFFDKLPMPKYSGLARISVAASRIQETECLLTLQRKALMRLKGAVDAYVPEAPAEAFQQIMDAFLGARYR